jgi:hypothetical protein
MHRHAGDIVVDGGNRSSRHRPLGIDDKINESDAI